MKEMCQLLYLALISSKPLIAIYTVAQSIQKYLVLSSTRNVTNAMIFALKGL